MEDFFIIDFGHDGASFAAFLNSSWQKHFAVLAHVFLQRKVLPIATPQIIRIVSRRVGKKRKTICGEYE